MTQETDRNNRKELIGVVRSKTGDKSVKVVYEYKIPHPLYKKEIRRKTTVHVHDEKNNSNVGDKVRIMATRPVSKLKKVENYRGLGKSSNSVKHHDTIT